MTKAQLTNKIFAASVKQAADTARTTGLDLTPRCGRKNETLLIDFEKYLLSLDEISDLSRHLSDYLTADTLHDFEIAARKSEKKEKERLEFAKSLNIL